MFRLPWYVACSLLVLVTSAMLYFVANRSLYYPQKYPAGFWDVQSQLGATDVWLQSDPALRLHAWIIRQPDSRFITLHLHGNAGNITHRVEAAREILSAGSSVLLLDYRGYGKSNGTPTESGLYADAQAAYEYLLRSGYHPQQIIVHGESLGTAVAVNLASERHCAALVLEASFTSAQEVAGTVLPVIGPLLIRAFNSLSKIVSVRVPMLFIHGDRDTIIPMRLGQALFAGAREPKIFWIVTGAGHNDIVQIAGPQYRQRLRSFYDGLPI